MHSKLRKNYDQNKGISTNERKMGLLIVKVRLNKKTSQKKPTISGELR